MRFYVLFNKNKMLFFNSVSESERKALELEKNPKIYYLEYGIVNYDGWINSIIAVLKCEEN